MAFKNHIALDENKDLRRQYNIMLYKVGLNATAMRGSTEKYLIWEGTYQDN
jgi:hypothetical protein